MDNTVIKGQSYNITSLVNLNLTNATAYMKYTNPVVTTESSLLCTIEDQYNLFVNVPANINTVTGKWLFWLYITYVNGDIFISKPSVIQVIEEGQL